MISFPGSSNLSHWLDMEEMEVSYTHTVMEDEQTPVVSRVSMDQTRQHGAEKFSLRCLVTPRDHKGASIWIGGTPYTKTELQTQLGANHNNNLTPHITFQLHEEIPNSQSRAGRSGYALFTRQEQVRDGFGFAVIPWIDVTAEGLDDATIPESDDLKEALLRFMRISTVTATATTAAAMEARMKSLTDGKRFTTEEPW